MENITYCITTLEEIRKAKDWLNKVMVSNSTGYFGSLLIKVNVRTPKGKELLIDFYFKSKQYYTKFKRVLRQLENRRR